MTPRLSSCAPVLIALLAACGPGPAPALPEEDLAFPSDTLEAPWGNLPSAAPLSGGRWAVVSSDFDAAVIADFGRKTLSPLGGAGQKAYVHPASVFSFADTVYLSDWGKRRATVWTSDGKLVDSIPAPDALRGSPPRARDAAGQLYFEATPQPKRDGSGNRDSAAVVRAQRTLTRFDTLARLAPLDLKEMRPGEPTQRFERMIFSGIDLWGVWPDGGVWIARLLHNQIDVRDPAGKVTHGPELPDPVYEVSEADRTRFLQTFPPDVRPKETDLPWALIHPPFVAAFMSPDGIWLEKSKPVLDSVRRIHVLDRQGNLKRVLRLKGEGRVVAIGADKILVAEQFARGIRLMQIRIPAAPPPPATP
ncbi:MAG TPA: hypothetical protein VFU23_09630 [Gemmatimonadales bacterium]|nr:hypothetical protein [Gemmatimonadales bacterium]